MKFDVATSDEVLMKCRRKNIECGLSNRFVVKRALYLHQSNIHFHFVQLLDKLYQNHIFSRGRNMAMSLASREFTKPRRQRQLQRNVAFVSELLDSKDSLFFVRIRFP